MKETEERNTEEVRERLEKQLPRRAEELGYELKKREPAAAATQACEPPPAV